jgi:hypothetical protein
MARARSQRQVRIKKELLLRSWKPGSRRVRLL